MVIPACSEFETLFTTLSSLSRSTASASAGREDIRVIVVVNNRVNASAEIHTENEKTLKKLAVNANGYPFSLEAIDATTPGLKNGVGEARKMGMDRAIESFLKSPHDAVVSLDADCLVSENYMTAWLSRPIHGSAVTVEFEHPLEGPAREATALYELYLRYFRWQLSKISSPFAYATIGSCLGTTADNYRRSGGMVRKDATEDFHFLGKLRKLGPIDHWPDVCVYPSARRSKRVYLGTGFFIDRYQEDPEGAWNDLLLPSPSQFAELRRIQDAVFSGDFSLPELSDIRDALDRIKRSTSTPKAYKQRALEAFDATFTWRILRSLSESSPHATPNDFLNWCRTGLVRPLKDAEALLRSFRDRDRASHLKS